MRGNQTGRHTFIMLAGVYLLYLAWQLFSGFKNGEASSPVFILAAVFFAVAGVVIIVTNIKAIVKLTNEAQTAETDASDDTDADDTTVTENATDSTSATDGVSAVSESEKDSAETSDQQ